jgi:predicted NUDIX family NTP pyrophosphohydrolase
VRRESAGLLIWRRRPSGLAVLLGHMGGPFWARKDAGAWTIFKGELEPDEEPAAAARREALEETGLAFDGPLLPLGSVRQAAGKVVHAFAAEAEAEIDPAIVRSNSFEIEWPPRSGRRRTFPEIDRALWLGVEEARPKLVKGQTVFLDRLGAAVAAAG